MRKCGGGGRVGIGSHDVRRVGEEVVAELEEVFEVEELEGEEEL